MGDNAKKQWEWHNYDINTGYQGKHVIRQPQAKDSIKVIDMSKSASNTESATATSHRQKDSVTLENEEKHSKTHKTEKKDKKRKKDHEDKEKHKSSSSKHSRQEFFNPILQNFVTSLTDNVK